MYLVGVPPDQPSQDVVPDVPTPMILTRRVVGGRGSYRGYGASMREWVRRMWDKYWKGPPVGKIHVGHTVPRVFVPPEGTVLVRPQPAAHLCHHLDGPRALLWIRAVVGSHGREQLRGEAGGQRAPDGSRPGVPRKGRRV